MARGARLGVCALAVALATATATATAATARSHASAPLFGLNLPALNGTSGTGAFLPGVYNFSYPASQLASMRRLGFTAVRLPVNLDTANDDGALAAMHSIVEATGGRAVICMFGTGNLTTHGTGRVDSMPATVAAWARVHAVFKAMPGVLYEVFNEPHGYSAGCNSPPCGTPARYLADMRAVISGAGLPVDRVILDALGWAQDALGLAGLGWDGLIGYHFYPWWLPGRQTKAAFSALLEAETAGISHRIHITEFGGSLDIANLDYEQPSQGESNVGCLQGMDDAVTSLRAKGVGVAGAFHWHGWRNGDSFSFFEPANKNGSTKVLKILGDCCGSS